ncbi:threonine-phosphate decarboxylase CobD [Marichromatium gracile]|uniref:threonine-phosphate decarboxylase n=1 Tax=Marichromatium gracile TaxID=1048 RepID=A0ABR5VHT9_MARGR|nr:threonine-phosphate decarboxylase CobD [Marichromatium gracile]KXX65286.1 threonine-phosphate decarboxylase [Marichromatium gracile]
MTATIVPIHSDLPRPEHGGRLRQAAARYDIPLTDWLDLSTGINPNAWPVPPLPRALWARLPETGDGLEQAAASYYGAPGALALAGSQAAIQGLPQLREPCRVGVPEVGYQEHAHGWRRAGHQLVRLPEGDPRGRIESGVAEPLDVLVVINPNNPTGRRWSRETLLSWHAALAARGGWLVVDEAFMDVTPEHSLLGVVGRPGLVVLRSLGKFFGLAGARVGFAWTEPQLRQRLDAWLGPWTLSGPARELARLALLDTAWQRSARLALARDSARLAALLDRHGLTPSGGSALFQWVRTPAALRIHEALARQGILVRLFEQPSSLRFGLPGDATQWRRLERALAGLTVSEGVPA